MRGTGVGRAGIAARCYGNHHVLAFFIVEIFYAQQHLIPLDAELGPIAHGQQNWMLVVRGTNVIEHTVGLKNIFPAK